MKRLNIFLLLLLLLSSIAWAEPNIIVSYTLTKQGEPKYKEGFKYLDYVNPNAPKGGTVTFASTGTYDNFNRYAQRGNFAAGSGSLYDTLMDAGLDEYDIYYGLIAEKIEYSDDFTWMIFHINPKATFNDGKPITSEDVVFSYQKFWDEGVEFFKTSYEKVKEVKALDKFRVKLTLKEGDKDRLISFAAGLAILPKHYWKDHNLSEPLTKPPLGGSAYKISDYKMGQFVVMERVKDYWAQNHPLVKGQNNYDFIRYDYYKDETVKIEAFKAGEFDYRAEGDPKFWSTAYTGPNFDKGYIKKEEIIFDWPQSMIMYAFNVQRPIFQDVRVREAITYALDFEWMNKNLLFGLYERTRSYFENTKYAAKGLPRKDELDILEKYRGKIPDRVFTEAFNPPVSDGSGNFRKNMRKALRLFKAAGWIIKNRKMTHKKTGKLFEFEVIIYSPSSERYLTPIQKNLEKMGIKMFIRKIDSSQYQERGTNLDYDMMTSKYNTYFYPVPSLRLYWHSKYIDSSYNSTGVSDPVIDDLVQKIIDNQYNSKKLLALGKSLDRVLQWNFFGIPRWHNRKYWLATWDKFSRPQKIPPYGLGFYTWWINKEKEANLPSRNAAK